MLSYFQDYKKILAFVVYALFVLLFWPFKTPLLFAVLFSFALHPVLKKIKTRFLKIKSQKVLVAGTLLVIMMLFFIPIFLLIMSAISQIKNIETGSLEQLPIYQKIQSVIEVVGAWLQNLSNQLGIDISSYIDLSAIAEKVSQIILPALTSVLTQLPSTIINFLIFLVSLYLLLTKTKYFKKWFQNLKLFSEKQTDDLTELVQRVCNLVLVSSVFVATAQALIISVACLFAGYTDFVLIFMIAFFLSFIPVVGSAPISLVLIIYSFANSNLSGAIILIIAALIAGSIDNVIRTYMLTGEGDTGMHPFVALLALIGSLSLFGFAGLFLGPIICELAFQISKILIDESAPENTNPELPHQTS